MALSKVPKLPAFLQGPLACSPDRCNYPGTPLPPISSHFDRSYAYLLLGAIYQELWAISTTIAFESIDRINKFVFRVVRSTKSKPSQILSSLATRQVDEQLEGLAKEIVTELFGDLVIRIDGVVREGLVNFGKEHFNVGTAPRCLHDLLAPQDWQRLQANAPRISALEHPSVHPSLAPLDPRPLFLRFSAAIATGQVESPSSWSEMEIWQDVVTTAQAICGGKLRRQLLHALAGDFNSVGYRELLRTPGGMLALSYHLLSAKPSGTLENFIDNSSQISQFMRFCRLSVFERSIGRASGVPLVQYIELTSQSGSLRLPHHPPSTYRADHPPLFQTSQAAFEFVKYSNYPSENFPSPPPLELPRFCPPSICSGRLALDRNYERVDKSILKWFRSELSYWSLQSMPPPLGRLRNDTMRRLGASLKSLDYATSAQQSALLSLLDPAIRLVANNEPDVSQSPTGALLVAKLAVKLVQGYSAQFGVERMPCLCDLTHMCDLLDDLVNTSEAEYSSHLNVLFASAVVPLPNGSLDEILAKTEEAFPGSGKERTGELRSRIKMLFEWIDIHILERLLKQHYLFAWENGAIYRSLTSSQILEEVWTALVPDDPFGESFRQSFVLYQELDQGARTDRLLRPLESRRMQARADQASHRGDLYQSSGLYGYATILDPTNAVARLNMASIRLQQADDSAEFYEWYRAIYDCSAALYYGPPSFKAYYRRGYALAHLKMYDKAILDFERALLLEPRNPVPQAHLKLAKKKLKAARSS